MQMKRMAEQNLEKEGQGGLGAKDTAKMLKEGVFSD